MNIGIVCYSSVGGSGIVATELAKALAARGHNVRLISSDPPFRLGGFQAGLVFHQVKTPGYPLFREPQYLLSLANKLVEVAREFDLDIIHAHYAIPHAVAAYLARQILAASTFKKIPHIVTTLHGTDVTIIGSDESYSETAAFCINQSDAVTAVSDSLRLETYRQLKVSAEIRVIPNFLDRHHHRRQTDYGLGARYRNGDDRMKLVVHISNFRPVKRADAVVRIFHRIQERVPARLLLIGDGPELPLARRVARELGVSAHVDALGEQEQVVPILSVADLFLLPSSEESFGVAALEAMACGVPVVASRVGGLPEVIEDGVSGFLHDEQDLDAMVNSAVQLLSNPELHQRFVGEGLTRINTRFCTEEVVPRYEALYKELCTDTS